MPHFIVIPTGGSGAFIDTLPSTSDSAWDICILETLASHKPQQRNILHKSPLHTRESKEPRHRWSVDSDAADISWK